MKEITVTGRDGKQSHLDSVYVRGNMIRFMVVPDMLQQAPMFKRVGPNAMKGRGIGAARGRATIMRGMYPLWLTHQLRPGAAVHPLVHQQFAGDQNVDSNMKIPSYASTVMASPDSSVLASFCRFRMRSISGTLKICETSFSVRASRVRTANSTGVRKKKTSSRTFVALHRRRVHRLAQHTRGETERILHRHVVFIILLQQTGGRAVVHADAYGLPTRVVPGRVRLV